MTISPYFRQMSIAAATLLGTLSAGATLGYPSVLLYQLGKKDSEFPLDIDAASWIGSIHGLAGIVGAIAPIIVQWKGRKLTFIAACLVIIIGWLLMYAANSTSMIFFCEFMLGFSSNVIITVSYDIITEMITPSYRNIVAQACCVFNAMGVATAGVLTRFLHWRMISIILSIPAVFAALISYTWLESPLWLAFKNDEEKCRRNFMKIRGTNEQSTKELEEVMVALSDRISRNKSGIELSFLKRLWHQASSKDFIIPALHVILVLNHVYWSGTSVILLYSLELISKTTQNETAAFIGGIIIYLVFVIGATISSILVKYFKNKTVLLVSTIGVTVCLLSAAITMYLQNTSTLSKESLIPLYFLVGFIMANSSGQTPIELLLSTELLPVKHRGLGGTLFVILANLLNGSSLKVSPYLFVYLELWGTFLIYTLNSTVCGLLIWKFVPETKGKTLQEIENYYTHGTFEIKTILVPNKEIKPILK